MRLEDRTPEGKDVAVRALSCMLLMSAFVRIAGRWVPARGGAVAEDEP